MTATYALIPAAGLGARFSTDGGNKVFAPLLGRPLLHWTVSAFAHHPGVDGIVVVTGSGDIPRCRALLTGLDKVLAVVGGANSRQASVQVGLFALGAAPDDVILVHDGARPLVSSELIDRCLDAARTGGSGVAALLVTDTLKRVGGTGSVVETVDRDGLWAVQTPQAFRYQTLLNAHVAASDAGYVGTDEASLVEHLGDVPVRLVPGDAENLKVTRPEDQRLAEAFLRLRTGTKELKETSMRVGYGYDIHRLVAGRRLVLGGVELAHPQGKGLDGHSDADVLLHAVCDALLGAAGLPDIGTLYPNTDSAYAGIDSMRLLADVAERLAQQGLTVINVDATLIAEEPKIAPFVARMRDNLAGALRLQNAQVGIKATTNEGLGALGRGEGIAAHAVASLSAAEAPPGPDVRHSPPM